MKIFDEFYLTIKQKLSLGFGLMSIISASIVIIGMNALQSVEYRTDNADDANRLVKYIYDIRTEEKNFILRGDEKEADDLNRILDSIYTLIEESKNNFNGINDSYINQLSTLTKAYDSEFEKYTALETKVDQQLFLMEKSAREVETILNTTRQQQKKQLHSVVGSNRQELAEELLEADTANKLIKNMLEIRRDEKNYQIRNDMKSLSEIEQGIKNITNITQKMIKTAERNESKKIYNQALMELLDYQKTFSTFIALRKNQQHIRASLVNTARSLEDKARYIRQVEKEKMEKEMQEAVLLSQLSGSTALILAIILSVILIRTIVKPIERVTTEMHSVVDDNFDLEKRLPVTRRDEIGELITAFNRFADKMNDLVLKEEESFKRLQHSQKMAALGRLTGGIAHDYNNMLSVIIGFSEMLQQSLQTQPDLLKYVEQIHQAGERSAILTQKLLGFSRHKHTEKELVSINYLLSDFKPMIQALLTSNVNLNYELASNIWPIHIDSGDFQDSILNLCINAKHAMENSINGKLKIITQNIIIKSKDAEDLSLCEGEYVLVKISDTGHGMSESIIEKIFDPYFSTKDDLGNGLGLSQLYGFMERCSGTVKVESTIDVGTDFMLYFPRMITTIVDDINQQQR